MYHDGWAVFRFWADDNRAPDCIEEDVGNLLVSVGTSISDLTEDKLNSNKRLLLDSLLKTNDGFSDDYSDISFHCPVDDPSWTEKGTQPSYLSWEWFDAKLCADCSRDIARLIQGLNKHDTAVFYANHVSPDSFSRAKVSVHVQQLSQDGLSNDKSQVEEISDILQWKLSKSVSNINGD